MELIKSRLQFATLDAFYLSLLGNGYRTGYLHVDHAYKVELTIILTRRCTIKRYSYPFYCTKCGWGLSYRQVDQFNFCPRCSKKIAAFVGANSRQINSKPGRVTHKQSKTNCNKNGCYHASTIESGRLREIEDLNCELSQQRKESPKKALGLSIMSAITGTGLCMVGPVIVAAGTALANFGSGVAVYGVYIVGLGIVIAIAGGGGALIVASAKLALCVVAIGSIAVGIGVAVQAVGSILPFIGGGLILCGIGLSAYAIHRSKILKNNPLANAINKTVRKVKKVKKVKNQAPLAVTDQVIVLSLDE